MMNTTRTEVERPGQERRRRKLELAFESIREFPRVIDAAIHEVEGTIARFAEDLTDRSPSEALARSDGIFGAAAQLNLLKKARAKLQEGESAGVPQHKTILELRAAIEYELIWDSFRSSPSSPASDLMERHERSVRKNFIRRFMKSEIAMAEFIQEGADG